MQGLFFTGSDTGAGKTVVTSAVARLLRSQGVDVRVCKPVATEASWKEGRLVNEDTLRLAESAGDSQLEEITPWVFSIPAAPPVSAREAGVSLSLDRLTEAVQRRWRPGALLLVEGVGGLLCPLTEEETVADLAARLGFPLIVVVRRSLGTLNHTLLTLEVARGRGLRVAGVVMNETKPVEGLAEESNPAELCRRMEATLLATIPYQPTPVPGWEQQTLGRIDWRKLAMESRTYQG